MLKIKVVVLKIVLFFSSLRFHAAFHHEMDHQRVPSLPLTRCTYAHWVEVLSAVLLPRIRLRRSTVILFNGGRPRSKFHSFLGTAVDLGRPFSSLLLKY